MGEVPNADELCSAHEDGQTQTVRLDTGAFPREAILRACYWLAAQATFSIAEVGHQVDVKITPAEGVAFEEVAEMFKRALVDFSIRVDVEARTGNLRDLIWRTAFAETVGHKA